MYALLNVQVNVKDMPGCVGTNGYSFANNCTSCMKIHESLDCMMSSSAEKNETSVKRKHVNRKK